MSTGNLRYIQSGIIMKNTKVVAIIPSRYGSTRFDGKPLAKIAGKSMIRRVYENVRRAECVTDVVVATDDQRIYTAVNEFGGNAAMTSEENRSGTDRVADAAAQMRLELDDIIVNVQGDQPLLDPRCIDELIAPFLSDHDLEMSTLAFKIIDKGEITNPKDVKVTFDNRGYALYFSRSPIPYSRDSSSNFDTYKHLGFYAYKRSFLETFSSLPEGRLETIEKLEQLRAIEYGHKILVVITEYDSPEVDLPEDIARIEKILADQP
jgi:3-deoxy-manno-octulosonate cytidylyltransferase (CMP-KDO synthetase)